MRAPQRTRQRRRLSRRCRTRHDASDEEPRRACDAVIMDVPGACPAEYQLVEGPPTLDEYLNLRMRAGLSPRRPDQALAALDGGWAALHVVHQPTATTVGRGRLLGDGGWYFHVLDMAVLPDHQWRGLGDTILGALLTKIHHHAPAGAYVSLMADPPGRRLYERHGFAATAPQSIGMAQILG